MKIKQIKSFFNSNFNIFTSVLSLIISILYIARGFLEGFNTGIIIVTAMNLIYIPLVFIFKRQGFSIFYLIYAVILIFLISFEETKLFNNYTALFMVCIVMMLRPELELFIWIIYFITVSIAFAINDEKIIHFFIHIVRSLWFITIVSYVLNNRFQRKKLILFDDEKKILNQLCQGKVYQKEVEGFSENTIYRKLKAARERNGNITRDQLVEMYRKEKEQEETKKQ